MNQQPSTHFTALIHVPIDIQHVCTACTFHHHRLLIGTHTSALISYHFNPPQKINFDPLIHINQPPTSSPLTSSTSSPVSLPKASLSCSSSIESNQFKKSSSCPSSDENLTTQNNCNLISDDLLIPINSIAHFGINKKPIDQLAAMHACNLLYSVSDGIPRLHSLDTFSLYQAFPFKSPYSFDTWTTENDSFTKLVIGLHKQLVLIPIPHTTDTPVIPPETIQTYAIPVAARSVCFTHQGTQVQIASSRELSTLHLSTGEFVVWYNWALNPPQPFTSNLATTTGGFFNVNNKLSTRVGSMGNTATNELIAFNNTYVLKLDSDGNQSKFDWGTQLSDIVQLGPYFIGALHPKLNSGLQVRIPNIEQSPLVTVQHFDQIKDVKCMLPCPLVPDTILIAHAPGSGSSLSLLVSVPFETILNKVTQLGYFETAYALVNATSHYAAADDRVQYTNSIHLASVQHAIKEGQFDDALAGFRDLCTPAEKVLNCFPFMATSNLSSVMQNTSEARRALIRFLTERRAILNRLRNPSTTLSNSASSIPTVSNSPAALRRSVLNTSTVASSKSSSFSTLAPDLLLSMSNSFTTSEMDNEARVVDMALVRAYLMDASDIMLGSLLRIKNECPIEETVDLLLEHGKFMLAVDFYFSKGVFDKAFELLMRKAIEPGTGDRGRTLVTYLQKLEMSPENLPTIFKYLGWMFQENEDQAMEFVQDCWLDAKQVVQFLRKISPRHVCTYLEYVMRTQHKDSAILHEEYIQSIIETILVSKQRLHSTDKSQETEIVNSKIRENGTVHDVDTKTEAGQVVSTPPDSRILIDPGSQTKSLSESKLLDFLSQSSAYDPERILEMIPDQNLLEVRLLLYERIGQIGRILAILIHELKDIDRAIDLVKNEKHVMYQPELIQQCSNAKWCTPDLILDILVQFSTGLPVEQVLEILTDLDPHLEHVVELVLVPLFTRVVAETNQARIVCALAEREHNVTLVRLTQMQLLSFTVDEQSLCAKCNKKIGQSAIVTWLSDQTVVHFACASSNNQK